MTAPDIVQQWLALEHAAVWFYPVIGARFTELTPEATTAFVAHRDTRDELLQRLAEFRVSPVSTKLSYDLGPLDIVEQARAAAQSLESRICAICLTLVGESTADLQTYAVNGLRHAALADLAWGALPRAFPGLP